MWLLNLLLIGCSSAPLPATPTPPFRAPVLAAPNMHSGVPYRLEIAAIELDTPVVELGWSRSKGDDGAIFSEWDVADNAAGWHKNSALIGQPGNIVLSGHNNILGAVFRKLDQIKEGDLATLWSNGKRYEYRIDKVMIVPEKFASDEQRRKNAEWIRPDTETRLTLVSCWPRNDNTHRIIVVAHPIVDVG